MTAEDYDDRPNVEVDRRNNSGLVSLKTLLEIRKDLQQIFTSQQKIAPADLRSALGNATFSPEDLKGLLTRLDDERLLKAERQGRRNAASKEPPLAGEGGVQRFLKDVRVKNGRIDIDEWFHHMLRHQTGRRIGRAVEELLALLDEAISANQGVILELDAVFIELAKQETTAGRAGFAEIVKTYSEKLWSYTKVAADTRVAAKLELCGQDPQRFSDEIASNIVDLNSSVVITADDFLACFLGRRRNEVRLFAYDLSKGKAQAMSRWLPMPQLEGLWHTGLVVHGWEYFYCGDVICAVPGETIFGAPARHIGMGYTLRSRAELHQFIVQELKPAFTRASYSTLYNNCNHFSDRLGSWLCGAHVPPDILQQHEHLLQMPLARTLWPVLNKVLGGDSLASSRDISSMRCHSVVSCNSIITETDINNINLENEGSAAYI